MRPPRDRVRSSGHSSRRRRPPAREALVHEHRLRARARHVHARRTARHLRRCPGPRGLGDQPQARARRRGALVGTGDRRSPGAAGGPAPLRSSASTTAGSQSPDPFAALRPSSRRPSRLSKSLLPSSPTDFTPTSRTRCPPSRLHGSLQTSSSSARARRASPARPSARGGAVDARARAPDGIGGRARTDEVGGFRLDRGFPLSHSCDRASPDLDCGRLDTEAARARRARPAQQQFLHTTDMGSAPPVAAGRASTTVALLPDK